MNMKSGIIFAVVWNVTIWNTYINFQTRKYSQQKKLCNTDPCAPALRRHLVQHAAVFLLGLAIIFYKQNKIRIKQIDDSKFKYLLFHKYTDMHTGIVVMSMQQAMFQQRQYKLIWRLPLSSQAAVVIATSYETVRGVLHTILYIKWILKCIGAFYDIEAK